jgi:flavin reductase (DIM6/NTAB) family NADH-FMN oxidoreductase RutF/DNA-binding IclR family transcriptional regulator
MKNVSERDTTSHLDPRYLRDVLGHYPTGVTVITAIDDEGSPCGMAVGSFTSVSLDPPLIAFLPAQTSTTFPRIRTAASFCVNILASDQEDVCRTFATPGLDKFANLDWSPCRSGAPVLRQALAWLDCTTETIHQAGDHFIVVGRVRELSVERAERPLIFHRGGYGSLAPSSLVAAPELDITEQIRIAGLARRTMESLAQEVGLECLASATVSKKVVLLASADAPAGTYARSRIGHRTPLVAPVGATFVAWADDATVDGWLSDVSPADRSRAVSALERVRNRQWSVVLGNKAYDQLEVAVGDVTRQGSAEQLEHSVESIISRIGVEQFEPHLAESRLYDVRLLSAPVFDADGRVVLALGLRGFARLTSGADTLETAGALTRAADILTGRVGGRRPEMEAAV